VEAELTNGGGDKGGGEGDGDDDDYLRAKVVYEINEFISTSARRRGRRAVKKRLPRYSHVVFTSRSGAGVQGMGARGGFKECVDGWV
jgi:hypothetical protein